jgi:hypothetical protein
MPNEFVARNGLIALNNVIITGSLTVATGSNIEFQVLNTGVRIGNLITDAHTITGSLSVSGSVTSSNDIRVNDITVGRGGGNQSNNTAIGNDALRLNTSQTFNTAIGASALISSSGGSGGNTAVGATSMRYTTVGSDNSAFGNASLFNNVNGNFNSAFGQSALAGNTNGSDNVAIGWYAGDVLGDGVTENTTPDFSVYIGSSTMASQSNGQNEIVIGYNAIGNGSNSVTLGNTSITRTILRGAVSASGGITGSLLGTATSASFTTSAANATTASIADNAVTASRALNANTASFATSAANATTASFATSAANATTASFATNTANATSASYATFANTASSANDFLVRGTLTATTIVAQVITSSTDFVTGSTRFGSLLANTHQFTGSVSITGSLTVSTGNGITGSLFGTSSWAQNAVTASYILNAASASYSLSSSYALNASNATSASFATNAANATSASFATSAANATSASIAANAVTASRALSANTASYVQNAASASYALSASNAQTASFVNTLNQRVVITDILAIATSSIGSTENTLIVGTLSADNNGEGGQILLQASGGLYTSASMLDTFQNRFRILRGTNASSNAEIFNINLNSGQLIFNRYTGSGAFTGTAAATLAVDSSGNVITTTGGSTTPGGLNTQIQYNNSNAFGGVSTLTFDGTTLRATGSFTGSFSGTATTASYIQNAASASYALTASFALNAGGGSSFPFTGSALITGSLGVTGSLNISTVGLATNRSFTLSSIAPSGSDGYNIFIGTPPTTLVTSSVSTGSSYNTVLGDDSLSNLTNGSGNTVIGYSSGVGVTSGSRNVMIGSAIMGLAQTGVGNGSRNIAIGTSALLAVADSNDNIAIGDLSLSALINLSGPTGAKQSHNIAIGSEAGRYYTGNNSLNGSSGSIFIGAYSAALTFNSINEIVIGSNATGSGNNSITLGNNNITKTILRSNVGIGTSTPSSSLHVVGTSLVSGSAVITGSLTITTTGSVANPSIVISTAAASGSVGSNLFIGTPPTTLTSTATNNIGIGRGAADALTSGLGNTALGVGALTSTTSGSDNVAIGRSALGNSAGLSFTPNSGSNNVIIGSFAAAGGADTSNNTIIGASAMQGNVSDPVASGHAVALGSNAGRYYGSGVDILSDSTGSIYIGAFSRGLNVISNNEIVIGANAIGNGNNSVTLGNTSITKTILRGAVTASIVSASAGFTGSLFGTASYALNARTVESITGFQYFVPVFNTTSSLITSSIYDSGSFTGIGATAPVDPLNPDRLFINAGNSTSHTLFSGQGNTNNYLQLNIKNLNAGATASSDIVATANNGDETNYFIDLGINSSGYNITSGVGAANDSYLYNVGGDLLIGNASTNKRLILFNGGTPALDNARVYITQQGTVGINASDTNDNNPEALLIEPLPGNPSNTFSNLIIGRGTVHESYLQFNLINQGTGSYASADIVASNDISTETSSYVDMGINSSNHIVDTTFAPGGPNDTYLLSTGRDLLIGSSTSGSVILWTGTDFNDKANAKLTLRNNNIHSLTGSLGVTQGITGSLFGTSSWAQNAVTASYIRQAASASFATSASQATTASYTFQAASASFATTASYTFQVVSASFATTASYTFQAVSASFATTASFVLGGSSNITIQDEGLSQGSAGTINFTGAGVTATVGGGTATITIPGGGGGSSAKAGSGSAASFGGTPRSSSITFGSAFSDNLYAVTVTGEDARTFTIQSKTSGSFIINSNSSVALTGPVYWIATAFN